MSDNYDEELPPDEQPPDDFANFDPAAYVAKHNQEMGRQINIDDPVNAEVRRANQGGRSRRRSLRQGDDLNMDHVSVGLMARIMNMFGSGENVRIYSDILRETIPVAGRFLPIIGCAIVF